VTLAICETAGWAACATALGAVDPRNADSPVRCFADCQSAGRAVVRDGRESEIGEIDKKRLLNTYRTARPRNTKCFSRNAVTRPSPPPFVNALFSIL
jgi:hypothetical protein